MRPPPSQGGGGVGGGGWGWGGGGTAPDEALDVGGLLGVEIHREVVALQRLRPQPLPVVGPDPPGAPDKRPQCTSHGPAQVPKVKTAIRKHSSGARLHGEDPTTELRSGQPNTQFPNSIPRPRILRRGRGNERTEPFFGFRPIRPFKKNMPHGAPRQHFPRAMPIWASRGALSHRNSSSWEEGGVGGEGRACETALTKGGNENKCGEMGRPVYCSDL